MSESRVKAYSAFATIAALVGGTYLAKHYLYDKEEKPDKEKSVPEKIIFDIHKFDIFQTIGIANL